MFRSALIALAALCVLALTSPAAHAAAAPAPIVEQRSTGEEEPANSGEINKCKIVAVICIGKEALDAITGITGGLIGEGAQAAAGTAMDGIVSWAAGGAAWLVTRIAEVVDGSTKRALDSAWFTRSYASMVQIAIALAALFLLLADGQAMQRQDMTILLRAVGALPLALIMTFIAVTLVQLGLGVTDWMTARVLESSGGATKDAFKPLASAFLNPSMQGFVVFLTAVLVSLFALAVWIELALREAAIYVSVAFLPLTFVAIVWRPTAIWRKRLTEGLVAIILSKFALAVAFTLAAGALGDPGGKGGGLSAIVAGGAVLLIAAFAPWILLRMIPFTQPAADHGISRQQAMGAAGSAPGATTATGAARMLMYGTFTGGAAPLPAGDSAEAGGPPAGASRNDGSRDVPVAVIPDPPSNQRTGHRDGGR
jgi:hypothetical protein